MAHPVPPRTSPPGRNIGKACLVISGPSLVALIPMAAVPALPAMAAHFGPSFNGNGSLFAQLVMTVPAAMLILSALVSGLIAERIGRKALLIGALALFTVTGLGALIAPDAIWLMALRLLLGISGGAILTVSLALAADFPEGGPREKILGFAVAGASALATIVLIGGGRLVDDFGWRSPFAFYALGIPAMVLAMCATWRAEERPASSVREKSGPWFRQLWWIYAAVVCLSIGMFTPSIQGPFLLSESGITSAEAQGFIIAACSVVAVLSSACFGWLVRWIRPTGIMVVIAACFGVGALMMALSQGVLKITIGSSIMGIAAGLVEATGATLVLSRVNERARTSAIGLLLSSIFLGQFLNPWVLDPLHTRLGIHGAIVAAGVGFLVLAALLAMGLMVASRRGARGRPVGYGQQVSG